MESNNNSNNNSAVRVVSTGRAGAFVNVREGQTIEEAAAAFAVAVSADSPPGAVPVAVPVHIPVASKPAEEDAGVIAAPASVNTSSSDSGAPAEIPPEPSSEGLLGNDEEEEEEDQRPDGEEEEDDDESEYEYEDDEDAAFSGFLVDHPPIAAHSHSHAAQSTNSNTHTMNKGNNSDNPARIRDEEESVHNNSNNNAGTAGASSAAMAAKPKWREPSRAAVSMSLRAEREKTGSKRRLAQDLYRIMNQETEEAGFSIAPKSEDNMDHWIIKLFMFDDDSNLAKDMLVLGFEHIELEMTFPDQYPFEPPFVRVVRPRFKRQTGFVMNGALCMELLTKDGWNPVNDIESVIVSIRSLLVVGDGRLQAAYEMPEPKYQARLKANSKKADEDPSRKRQKKDDHETSSGSNPKRAATDADGGSYSVAEAHAAYSHLSDYHKKKGWDTSGWWARKG